MLQHFLKIFDKFQIFFVTIQNFFNILVIFYVSKLFCKKVLQYFFRFEKNIVKKIFLTKYFLVRHRKIFVGGFFLRKAKKIVHKNFSGSDIFFRFEKKYNKRKTSGDVFILLNWIFFYLRYSEK